MKEKWVIFSEHGVLSFLGSVQSKCLLLGSATRKRLIQQKTELGVFFSKNSVFNDLLEALHFK